MLFRSQRYTRPASINWERTLAYASDMSGIKSYSYGGIILNRAALNGRSYEKVRDEIVDLLLGKLLVAPPLADIYDLNALP